MSRSERKALRTFARFTDFEPLSRYTGIGLTRMKALVADGLAEEGCAGVYGPTFRLTAKGREAAASLANHTPPRAIRQQVEQLAVRPIAPDRLELTFLDRKSRTKCMLDTRQARRLTELISRSI